jgi:hypothetical protein
MLLSRPDTPCNLQILQTFFPRALLELFRDIGLVRSVGVLLGLIPAGKAGNRGNDWEN